MNGDALRFWWEGKKAVEVIRGERWRGEGCGVDGGLGRCAFDGVFCVCVCICICVSTLLAFPWGLAHTPWMEKMGLGAGIRSLHSWFCGLSGDDGGIDVAIFECQGYLLFLIYLHEDF